MQSGGDLDRLDRIAPQFKKVVPDSDALQLQDLLPGGSQSHFHLGDRFFGGAFPHQLFRRLRKRPMIHLPVGG